MELDYEKPFHWIIPIAHTRISKSLCLISPAAHKIVRTDQTQKFIERADGKQFQQFAEVVNEHASTFWKHSG